jgi:hypothetical protein
MMISLDKSEDCKYAGELHLPPSKSWHQVLATISEASLHLQKDLNRLLLPDKKSSPIGWFELANHYTLSLSQSCTTFWYKAVFIVRIWTLHIWVFTFRNKRLSSSFEDKLWQLHVSKGHIHAPETRCLPQVETLSHFRVLKLHVTKQQSSIKK